MAEFQLPTQHTFEEVTANKTLDEGDSGVAQVVNANATITLPATVVGTTYTIIVGGEGESDSEIDVTISPNAADKIMGNGYTSADDKDIVCTNGRSGVDFVTLVGDGVNGWFVQACSGTWTRQA